jgi:hypothetical protein
MISNTANAANWEFAPRVEGGYRYDDNYRLNQPGNEIEVSGAEVDATMRFRTVDPRTKVELAPRIRATYFPDEGDEDSTDYFFRGTFADQTPRHRLGVEAGFSREDVVRTEFSTNPDGALGSPDTVETNLLQRNRRDLYNLVPSFDYQISQRQRLEIKGRYVNAKFDNNFAGLQEDYNQADLSVGIGFLTSQRSSLTASVFGSRYNTSDTANAYGAGAEWSTQLSPTSRTYVRVGGQRTNGFNDDTQTSWVGGVGGEWMSERNHLFLDVTRTVDAVSAGAVVERMQLRFRLNHDISERISMLLGLRAIRDEGMGDSSTYPQRDYATGEAGLEWRVQRSLAFSATYTYRWQDDDRLPTDVSANGFLIGVTYEPRRAN